jgi:hypothetical protein
MRKSIWLALVAGALELVRREANQRGMTPSALLSNIIAKLTQHFRGPQSDTRADA